MDATPLADETRTDTVTTLDHAPRPLGALLVVVGLAHLLAPGLLLWTASLGYRWVLAVEFDPRQGATRRVRLAGLGMVAAGGHLLYYGGIRRTKSE